VKAAVLAAFSLARLREIGSSPGASSFQEAYEQRVERQVA
jgi:hypothetical protein